MALSLALAGRAARGCLGVRRASVFFTEGCFSTTKAIGRRTISGAVGSGASEPDDEVIALSKISTQSIVDALWLSNYPQPYIHGARPMLPGMTCAGRAVTLRFVPHRPDIAADKPQGVDSPEYVAFELCGPGQVLVTNSCGPYESVGGDIKFLRLAQNKAGGIVTEGSVRDTGMLEEYGLNVFSFSTTAKQGPAVMQPWAVNEAAAVPRPHADIELLWCCCGSPGDVVVGDADGVVVVPQSMTQTVVSIAAERERIEDIIKDELTRNPGSPGKYYPFRQPLTPGTALFDLVQKRDAAEATSK